MYELTLYCDPLELTIKKLVREQKYRSQRALAGKLEDLGYGKVAQSKVSRTLAKLGAVKTRNANNEIFYHIPESLYAPKIDRSISSLVISIFNNGSLIVVKTAAGGATIVGKMLESLENPDEIAGTIAGHDILLVIPMDIRVISAVERKVAQFLKLLE